MLKRVLSFILAFAVFCSCFSIPASADLLEEWQNGESTVTSDSSSFSEFKQWLYDIVTTSKNTSRDLRDCFFDYVDNASDLILKQLGQMFGLFATNYDPLSYSEGDTCTSADGRVTIVRTAVLDDYYQPSSKSDHIYTLYFDIYVDGAHVNANSRVRWYDAYYYDVDKLGETYYFINGTVLYYTFHDFTGGGYSLKTRSYDFSSYLPSDYSPKVPLNNSPCAGTDGNTYYINNTDNPTYVTDSEGNKYYFNPDYSVTNNYGDTVYIYPNQNTFDLSGLFDTFMRFISQMIECTTNSISSLYDLIAQLINSLNGSGSGKDYSELLNSINIAILSLSTNLTNISQNMGTHQDLMSILASLEGLKNSLGTDFEYNYTDKLNSILSKLDVMIALMQIDIATDENGEIDLDKLSTTETLIINALTGEVLELISIVPVGICDTLIIGIQKIFIQEYLPSDISIDFGDYGSAVLLNSELATTVSPFLSVLKALLGLFILYKWLMWIRQEFTTVLG